MIRLRVAALGTGGDPTPLELTGEEYHYLVRVRRGRVGEVVELFDGSGRSATATISAIGPSAVTLARGPVVQAQSSRAVITAAIPLIKGERMEQCLEKLVEVGVDHVVLWTAQRAVVRLDGERRDARLAKLQAQLETAVRQSGRDRAPTIDGVWSLAQLLSRTATGMDRIALDAGGPPLMRAPTAEGSFGEPSATLVISGPEGGFAPEELAALDRDGVRRARVGDFVLRAETAPVVAVALLRWLEATAPAHRP